MRFAEHELVYDSLYHTGEDNIEIVKAYKEWTHYFITNASYYQVLQYRLNNKQYSIFNFIKTVTNENNRPRIYIKNVFG